MVDYSDETKKSMKLFFDSLPEKSRRHYAALEAKKLGYRGVTYVSKVLGIDRSTIHEGLKELKDPLFALQVSSKKQRRAGGGSKKNFNTTGT